jgi:hypothetical protein
MAHRLDTAIQTLQRRDGGIGARLSCRLFAKAALICHGGGAGERLGRESRRKTAGRLCQMGAEGGSAVGIARVRTWGIRPIVSGEWASRRRRDGSRRGSHGVVRQYGSVGVFMGG